MNRLEQLDHFRAPQQHMDWHTIRYIREAIEELEDYIPMLENQDAFNHTVITHSVQALKQTFDNYGNNP